MLVEDIDLLLKDIEAAQVDGDQRQLLALDQRCQKLIAGIDYDQVADQERAVLELKLQQLIELYQGVINEFAQKKEDARQQLSQLNRQNQAANMYNKCR